MVPKLFVERAGVTPEEAALVYNELMMWWQYYAEKVIRYMDELSLADRHQAESAMRAIFGDKTGQLFLEIGATALNPDAYQYMQELLRDTGE
jgi:hypothetical protein